MVDNLIGRSYAGLIKDLQVYIGFYPHLMKA